MVVFGVGWAMLRTLYHTGYASMLKKKTKLILEFGIRGGMWLLRALCGIFVGKERLRGKNFLG